MKSKEQKQKEAVERAKLYKFEDSKAKRLGTKTKEEWESARQKILESK